MSASATTDGRGTPLFVPKPGSSVSKQSHDARRTLKTRLMYPLLFKPVATALYYTGRKQAPSGPQQVEHFFKQAVEASEGVTLEQFSIDDPIREDPRFNLQGWQLHQVSPASAQGTQDIKRTILYFPGGGFRSPMLEAQVNWVVSAAKALRARLICVPYELAPHTNAPRSIPKFVKIFEQVWLDAKLANKHELFVMGDSAGGNIACVMPLAIKQLLPHLVEEKSRPHLEQMYPDMLVSVSPLLNSLPENNPAAAIIEKQDYIFDRKVIKQLMGNWAIGSPELQKRWIEEKEGLFDAEVLGLLPEDLLHPYVSPALHDAAYEVLKEKDIKVVLHAPTSDILYEGSLTYLQKCEEHGVKVAFIEGLRGCHTYNIFPPTWMAESAEANKMIYSAIEASSKEQQEHGHASN